jgi:hypothetical protein
LTWWWWDVSLLGPLRPTVYNVGHRRRLFVTWHVLSTLLVEHQTSSLLLACSRAVSGFIAASSRMPPVSRLQNVPNGS